MKILTVLVLLSIICAALALSQSQHRRLFRDFQKKYNKKYASTSETELRFKNFQASLARASASQSKNPKAKFGVTKFSDMTPEEFSRMYKMPNFDKAKFPKLTPKNFSAPQKPHVRACSPDPTNYDWDSCGVVTSIYNQEQCGSCWAFSATETIESYWALAGNSLTSLSPQQIVDCDTGGQDQGCDGGFPSGAYSYVESAGGMETWQEYPYDAADGTCQFNQQDVVAKISGSNSVSGEQGLYQQTSSSSGGPVSVCVDASSWQDYNGGVLTQCGNDVDHCVQLVGYAQYNQQGAYWVVRNSWGSDWGQSGFIWVAIGQDLCSIGDYATIVSC